MAPDRIALSVPSKSEYARTVRLAAAELASRTDMNLDEVDDVRMAAEEAFVYAVDTLPPGEDVRFEFTVSDDEIVIDVPLGRIHSGSDEDAEQRATYATFILQAVCNEYEFSSDEKGAHLRLVKRAGSADAG